MNINKHIVETKNKLLQIINESNLPLAVFDLIVSDLHKAIVSQLQIELNKEDAPDENTDKSKEA